MKQLICCLCFLIFSLAVFANKKTANRPLPMPVLFRFIPVIEPSADPCNYTISIAGTYFTIRLSPCLPLVQKGITTASIFKELNSLLNSLFSDRTALFSL